MVDGRLEALIGRRTASLFVALPLAIVLGTYFGTRDITETENTTKINFGLLNRLRRSVGAQQYGRDHAALRFLSFLSTIVVLTAIFSILQEASDGQSCHHYYILPSGFPS